ncbi:MAG: hypothetical protein FJX54_11040 [Alphaproteobacteria bacterium]|nr:hypothetical protein [Alphaproteobacteria bacterium]
MKLKRALQELVRVIVDEADRNPEFAQKIEQALGYEPRTAKIGALRPVHRRASPVLDPVALAREGETVLRERLAGLTLEQLRDVVADYGMDPGKLVLKWKVPSRIIDRIVEVSLGRAKKGEVFLS